VIELAGGLGFEPRFSESESDVLPSDDSPKNRPNLTANHARRADVLAGLASMQALN
jgi:hypothetical protein